MKADSTHPAARRLDRVKRPLAGDIMAAIDAAWTETLDGVSGHAAIAEAITKTRGRARNGPVRPRDELERPAHG